MSAEFASEQQRREWQLMQKKPHLFRCERCKRSADCCDCWYVPGQDPEPVYTAVRLLVEADWLD